MKLSILPLKLPLHYINCGLWYIIFLGVEFISWGCFRKWRRKEKGDSRNVWRCDRLSWNHTKHTGLGGAVVSFSFSVRGGESIAQSMTGLLTAGGRKAVQQEKFKSANCDPERLEKHTHFRPSPNICFYVWSQLTTITQCNEFLLSALWKSETFSRGLPSIF